jgi:hypothetical protein
MLDFPLRFCNIAAFQLAFGRLPFALRASALAY